MADGYISQIKTPDNKTYLLRDSEKTDEKVSQASNSENKEFPIILKNTNNTTKETAGVKYAGGVTVNPDDKTITADEFIGNLKINKLIPINEITYPAYTCSADNEAKAVLFFGKVTINDTTIWQAPWTVRYRVYASTTEANTQGWYDCNFTVSGSTVNYHIDNNFYSGSYRPIYNHRLVYPKNGYSSYGAYFGVRIQSSRTPTSLARVLKVELLEATNCTVELFPSIKRFDEIYVTTNNIAAGTIWYNTDYNGTDAGLRVSGNANTNDTGYYILTNGFRMTAGTNKVSRYTLFGRIYDGTYESFTITSNSTATTKEKNPHGFLPDGKIYWNSAGGEYTGAVALSVYEQYHSINYRYTFNITTTGIPANTPTYVKWTYANGLLYLADEWFATTLPTTEDGFIYQRIGSNYYGSADYRASLLLNNPYYIYKSEGLQVWNPTHLSAISGADDLKAIEAISGTTGLLKKTAANTWTLDTSNYVTSSGITSVTIGATSPVQSSTSTAQTGSSASTTISLANAYGDTKNPYGSKTKNYVLAAPNNANGAPSFRALVAADIPTLAYVPATSGANDVNTLVNTGIYNITSGQATNAPKGYGYGQLLVMSYRKHTGNTTTDWASQIYLHNGVGTETGNATGPGNVLYYRTSNTSSSNSWFSWQKAVHVDDTYIKVGDTNKPVYIAADGTATPISYTIAKSVPSDAVFTDHYAWPDITSKPTTISGYGITDAKIASGTITLGSNTISPVTAINWDSTNKKLTRTINGAAADVVTAATLRTDLGLSNALHFIGITSTTLADGSTTSTLTAKSTGSLTKTTGFVDGDVVMDGDQLREYVWSGSAWRLLGITTSTAYTQPASTATNTWIAQVSQGTDGKITATTGSLNTSGTWSGTASKATTTANTSDSIYPVGVKSGATTTLLHDTSITMKGNAITAVTYNSTAASLTSETSTTANTAKYATLTLGNNANVSTTTAHSEGQIVIYSAATQAHTIKGTSTTTAYTHTLPNDTGLLVSLSSGTAKGSSTKPVYIPNTGIVTECSTYAGGTKVTFNGADKGASTASFYAPTSGGTAGNVLISAGTSAPAWYGGAAMTGTAAANWKTAFNGTTDATASNAAAVTIAGGLGIAKSLIVGEIATVADDVLSPRFTLTVNGTDKAYLQYNTTDDSIDFIFV